MKINVCALFMISVLFSCSAFSRTIFIDRKTQDEITFEKTDIGSDYILNIFFIDHETQEKTLLNTLNGYQEYLHFIKRTTEHNTFDFYFTSEFKDSTYPYISEFYQDFSYQNQTLAEKSFPCYVRQKYKKTNKIIKTLCWAPGLVPGLATGILAGSTIALAYAGEAASAAIVYPVLTLATALIAVAEGAVGVIRFYTSAKVNASDKLYEVLKEGRTDSRVGHRTFNIIKDTIERHVPQKNHTTIYGDY